MVNEKVEVPGEGRKGAKNKKENNEETMKKDFEGILKKQCKTTKKRQEIARNNLQLRNNLVS